MISESKVFEIKKVSSSSKLYLKPSHEMIQPVILNGFLSIKHTDDVELSILKVNFLLFL